jgi:cysteine-rich repeat protein
MRSWLAFVVVALLGCGRTELLREPGEPVEIEPEPRCGDGNVDPLEACDDGNLDPHDSCLDECRAARCGDGVVRRNVEACDDGNAIAGDGCTVVCGLPTCGNGSLEPGEVCDDGNASAFDSCLPSCLAPFCGDGYQQRGLEICDDGNDRDDDACVACVPARCGDGFVQRGVEECDDGNRVDDDECSFACTRPVCGDGRVAGQEQCDLGPNNGDRPAFLITQPGLSVGTNALIRNDLAAGFYDYRSASSHTGLENAEESRVYLFVSSITGGLSLIVTHGIDDDTGQQQPRARVDLDILDLPFGTFVELADDNAGELFMSGPTTALGRWRFEANSDGGILGGVPFPAPWRITIVPRIWSGISSWRFVLADGSGIALDLGEPLVIEAFDSRSSCRANCTIPRCGDGTLDGGEVCDDGNLRGGDGCAANCLSVF